MRSLKSNHFVVTNFSHSTMIIGHAFVNPITCKKTRFFNHLECLEINLK
jgi:hypothetical protein